MLACAFVFRVVELYIFLLVCLFVCMFVPVCDMCLLGTYV